MQQIRMPLFWIKRTCEFLQEMGVPKRTSSRALSSANIPVDRHFPAQ
jgi:hypothetical protein